MYDVIIMSFGTQASEILILTSNIEGIVYVLPE
jgi:hypothetical protein